jgi:hypothetical protein
MLWTICVVLLVVWALGAFVPSSPVRENNLVHVLLVIAVIVVIYQLLGGGGLHLFRRR